MQGLFACAIRETLWAETARFGQGVRVSCNLLITSLGKFADPWKEPLSRKVRSSYRIAANATLGALNSIKENIELGRLLRVEDLVFAEAFANLIEQAEYLLERNYHLASGVLLRAVLEEKLRLNQIRPTWSLSFLLGNGFQMGFPDFHRSVYRGDEVDDTGDAFAVRTECHVRDTRRIGRYCQPVYLLASVKATAEFLGQSRKSARDTGPKLAGTDC